MIKPVSERPVEPTPTQEEIALRWLTKSPTHHGFEAELRTAARLGPLNREGCGVGPNPRYLSTRLRERGYTPQKPERVPRDRDPNASAAWPGSDRPRTKEKRGGGTPKSP